jgi:hypothetical protein
MQDTTEDLVVASFAAGDEESVSSFARLDSRGRLSPREHPGLPVFTWGVSGNETSVFPHKHL